MVICRFSVGRYKVFSSFEHVASIASGSRNSDFRTMKRELNALMIGRWNNTHLMYPWPSKKDVVNQGNIKNLICDIPFNRTDMKRQHRKT